MFGISYSIIWVSDHSCEKLEELEGIILKILSLNFAFFVYNNFLISTSYKIHEFY